MWAVARPPARRPDFLPLLRRGRSSKGIKKETEWSGYHCALNEAVIRGDWEASNTAGTGPVAETPRPIFGKKKG